MASHKFTSIAQSQIAKHDCVSFDVFDTLITRDCERPEDVFTFVENHYNNQAECRCIDFAQMRKDAEVSLYKDGILPTLDQIYDRMTLSDTLRVALETLELETEMAFCQRCSVGYSLYQYAKESGKKIIAISDMYLSSDTIRMMLHKAGYEIEEIYVSCEYGTDKTHGKLYTEVLKGAGIKKNQIVHFGDNITADFLGARIAGIHAVQIPNEKKLYYFKKSKDEFANRYLRKFAQNRCQLIDDHVSKLGYEVFGPTVVGFCQWVHEHAQANQYDILLFCARDMLQTFQIYQRMYPEERDCISYLYVSVKSIELPYLAATGEDQSDYAVEQLKMIREYLTQCGCCGNVALVDSGFSGRSQKMLSAIMREQCEIHGLYMRVNKTFYKNITDKASYAYLYSKSPNEGYYIGAAFFESMIAATHGRTIGYKREANGRVCPLFGDPNPNARLLERFQDGISRFAADYLHSPFQGKIIRAEAVQNTYLFFCFFPEKEDVRALETVLCGDDEYSQIIIKRKGSYYIKHPIQFLLDLKDTNWKGGYLSRTCGELAPMVSELYLRLGKVYLRAVGESGILLLEDSSL